jgi:hypothetical protein
MLDFWHFDFFLNSLKIEKRDNNAQALVTSSIFYIRGKALGFNGEIDQIKENPFNGLYANRLRRFAHNLKRFFFSSVFTLMQIATEENVEGLRCPYQDW